jgi:hypothetical protein
MDKNDQSGRSTTSESCSVSRTEHRAQRRSLRTVIRNLAVASFLACFNIGNVKEEFGNVIELDDSDSELDVRPVPGT